MTKKPWIYLRSSDNKPVKVSGRYIERIEEGIDPNTTGAKGSFGLNKKIKLAEYITKERPTYNQVTERLDAIKSPDIEGVMIFGYFDNDLEQWIDECQAVENTDLDQARSVKRGELEQDNEAAKVSGVYAQAFTQVNAEYLSAIDAISTAADVDAIDSVTWDIEGVVSSLQ